jgi:hypothetical protein
LSFAHGAGVGEQGAQAAAIVLVDEVVDGSFRLKQWEDHRLASCAPRAG